MHLTQTFTFPSAEHTTAWGEALGMKLASTLANEPVVLGLIGHLGAGKTTLARAIARGMGIARPVTSPTFTIERRYPLPNRAGATLRHYDFYRLDDHSDLIELGFEERAPGDILLVEWIDRFPHLCDAPETCLLQLEAPDPANTPDTRRLRCRLPEILLLATPF